MKDLQISHYYFPMYCDSLVWGSFFYEVGDLLRSAMHNTLYFLSTFWLSLQLLPSSEEQPSTECRLGQTFSRSDTLPHLRTEKIEIHTLQQARIKCTVTKELVRRENGICWRCKYYQRHFSMRDVIIWPAIVPCVFVDV